MNRFLTSLSLGIIPLAMLLSACDKDNSLPPAPLTTYAFTAHPNVLWAAHPTWGSGQGTVLGLDQDATHLIAVGADGDVALLQKSDGKTLWKTRIPHEISARAVLAGDSVFVPTRDGYVVGLDALNGKIRWSHGFSSFSLAGLAFHYSILVVHQHNGDVIGFDPNTQTVLWTYSGSTPALELQGSSAPVMNDHSAYVGDAKGQLFSFDVQTGVVKWNRPIAIQEGSTVILRMIDVNATPILTDTALYAAAYHGNLVSMNPYSGDIFWQHPFSIFQTMDFEKAWNALIVVDEQSDVFKVNAENGQILWKQPALEHRELSPPVSLGAHILVGDLRGYVHVLANQDGALEARLHPTRQPIIDVISDEKAAYFLDKEGKVEAISVS